MSVTNYLSEIAKPHWPWHGLVDCVALKDLSLHIADLASIRPVSSLSGVGLVLGRFFRLPRAVCINYKM